ncbi:prolyl oligopeptidase family serine peptidase [Glacieibacterium frigidum]|uniref:Prolyl oligopeptidase family serine peptidase n=1 Tax=Glacieibacterium frigidum TaxID=2593303 RepID=A0A552UJ73_9SPHN|nr:prolyl oligopeptidase family serine peptidase [Glacieibacterium frigidum]TRW18283.1 prolyl oligopeptidase family serine peptidase [Glacieibacterium frigidum]
MKRTLAAALALIATPLAAAPAKFEPADLYRLSMVTDPKVAPDGERILFTRASFDIQTDSRQGEIWLATLGGKTLDKRLLIGAAARASRVEWSPDGSAIAYIAPWLGKPQLWVMKLSDGVGRVVTTGKNGPGGFAWSPDGSRIAFVARVEAPPRRIAGMPDKPEGATWAAAPKLITDFSYRSDSSGYATAGADQLFVVPAAGGAATQLTKGDFDQVGDDAVAWTKDSASILFSAMHDADRDLRARESDLFSVPAAGGAVTQLTRTRGSESNPKVSPDGRSIAFTGALDTPTFYAQDDVWVMPAGGGEARNLTRSLDRPIISYSWSGDGRGVHALYNDRGVTRVAFVPLDGGKPRVVVNEVGGTRLYLPSSGGSFSEAAGTFAYPTLEADRPAGLGITRGGKQVAGVDFNTAWRAGKSIGKLERIAYKSSDGLDIEGWVQFPPDFDPAKADFRTPIAQTEAYYGALKLRGVDTMMVRLPEAGHSMGRPSQWLQSILTVVEWYDKYKVK